jgi:hypothetical protein
VQVLTKSPEGKGIDEGDMFRFNAGFTDKMRRIKVGFAIVLLPAVRPVSVADLVVVHAAVQ